jgi:hypothetical protein
MNQTFNNAQIQQFKLAMKQVLVDELGENYKQRFDRIENNTDAACKVAKDTDEELTVTQAKVDDHEVRITDLESNFATT